LNMPLPASLPRNTLFCAMLMALGACGANDDASAPRATALAANDRSVVSAASEQAMIDEISGSLQACSYDGSPVRIETAKMAMGVNASGKAVVGEIMKFTGLPQNFDVVEHPEVPNAAAVIMLGPDKLPRRVIAYNPAFMSDVRKATANNNWAPISIMAHEIGHHLSGHTIQPGGSQPPTELEADKFSGFVLYKMGAALVDAQKAMNALVPDRDGPTHPGRGRRLRAIAEGWEQACAQQGGDCRDNPATVGRGPDPGAVASTSTKEPFSSAPPPANASRDVTPPAPIDEVAKTGTTARIAADAALDVLPAPDANALPAKFGKFVIDELGILDPAARAAFEQRMFEHAEKHGIEIVSIVARDLHGLSADEYAQAMMRQLRVGKLDVGNGAVLVASPNDGQVGVAMGPGVMLEMRSYIALEKKRLSGFIDSGYPNCRGVCNAAWTGRFFAAAAHIADDTDSQDWQIRFQSLGEILRAFEAEQQTRSARRYDPKTDPTNGKILRLQGELVSRSISGALAHWVNEPHIEIVGGDPIHVVSEGRDLLIYVAPETERLMVGKLTEGGRYSFIVRESSLSRNPRDALSFDLLSFDALP
jgi:hypothetical protein